ncbi:hypothetical protein TFLX_00795 [Thermoflexales bacterium]|nr:hypothetical protein TFLX_00795 [Thermoflexales bacterium]
MTLNPQIQALWQEHSAAMFPKEYGGKEIDGVDLVLLDADTSGCIQTLVSNGGQLDIWRTAILGLCYRDLAVVTTSLHGEAREYFTRLETLAGVALRAIRDTLRATSDQEHLQSHR